MDSKDDVAFAYGYLIQCKEQNKHKLLQCDANPVHMSNLKEVADGEVSRNMIIVEMTGYGDEISSMDVWLD